MGASVCVGIKLGMSVFRRCDFPERSCEAEELIKTSWGALVKRKIEGTENEGGWEMDLEWGRQREMERREIIGEDS